MALNNVDYNAALKSLNASFDESGTRNFSDDLSGLVPGTESYNNKATHQQARVNFNQSANHGENVVRNIFTPDELSQLSQQQLKAGAIAAVAMGDFENYERMATKVTFSNESYVPGGMGSDKYYTYSTEHYTGRDLKKSKLATVVINVGSARQDDFGELFFPTEVLTPDQGNVELHVENTLIIPDYLHTGPAINGVGNQFNGKPLIEAIQDPTILRDSSIDIIPQRIKKHEHIFTTEVKAFTKNGIQTGALILNRDIDLLASAFNPAFDSTNIPDTSDDLDHDVAVQTIWVKITSASKSKSEVIPIEIGGLINSGFVTSNGYSSSRDLQLNFNTNKLPIHGEMLTDAGVESEVLEYLRTDPRKNWVVHLDVTLTGTVNLATSNIKVGAVPSRIAAAYNCPPKGDGLRSSEKITEATAFAELEKELTFEVVGWYPRARRSNMNRRTRGIMTLTDRWQEVYTIPMGPPVSAIQSVVAEAEGVVDLEAPIKVNRIRNSQNALRTLLDFGDLLSTHVNVDDYRHPKPDIKAIGRYVVRPYYYEAEIDLNDVVDSIDSAHRINDLNHAVTNIIRAFATTAWSVSGYNAAWDAMGMSGKVQVNIGTNSVIQQYLDILGDDRNLGPAFTGKIVSTNNKEIGDWIIINFTSNTDKKIFNSGTFYYIPEIVSSMPKTTNGGQSLQLICHNRNLHVCHSPIQIRIKLKGITDILTKKLPYKIIKV